MDSEPPVDHALGEGPPWELRFDGGDIVSLTWKPGVTINAVDARQAVDQIRLVTGGVPHPLLVDLSGVESVDRPAREVFLRAATASKVALLGASMVDRIVAAFYTSVKNRNATPSQFFTSRPRALEWLSNGGESPEEDRK